MTTGPATPASAPDPKRLGHFRIVKRLGSGGMGVVYRAVDEKLHRDVALKLLTAGIGDGDDRRKRFEREARAIAALSHPNIVAVHSVEHEDGNAFLVMELIEGETIADAIPKGGMELLRLLDVAVPLAGAVAAAHEHGIVHRDLKPQNVMITSEGAIKVLDFGLAKLAEAPLGDSSPQAATMTIDGRILGTPAYMSPEQAEGKVVDARSDVFSLGVMLYEMAVGELPFSGGSTISLISSVLRDDPAPIHSRRPGLPPQLWRIVRRCLAKEPKRRYQSSRDLCNDLEELRGEISTGAFEPTLRPPPPGGHATGPGNRGRVGLLVAGGVGLLVAGVVAGRRFAMTAPADGAALPVAPAPITPAAPHFTRLTRMTASSSMKASPVLSSDGKWFAYCGKTAGNWDVWRQRVGGANPANLTAGSGVDNTEPAISPDGESIAFVSQRDGGGIYVMGATGESARRLTNFGHSPSWSPDGKRLVISTVDVDQPLNRLTHGELWTVDVATGERQKVDTGEDSTLPAWSPDGRFIAYHYWDSFLERGIAVVDAAGGKPVHVFRGLAMWTPAWSPDGRHVYASLVRMGDTNVWRVPFDAASRVFGEPEAVTNGIGFELSNPSLSKDGHKMLVSGTNVTSNLARIRFDVATAKTSGPMVPITRGSNRYGDIDVSPDGKWIVFASGWYGRLASTQEDLYIAHADGTDIRKLTDDAPYDRAPRWTHDGKRIVFYSQRGEVNSAGSWSISRTSTRAWAVAPDGSGLALVFGGAGDHVISPTPSPVDSRATAVLWNRSVIFDLDRPAERAQLAEFPLVRPDAHFYPCSWSADGRIVYGSDLDDKTGEPTGTYSFDVATSTYRRLGPPDDLVVPLPDGRHLLYSWQDTLDVLDTADGSSRILIDPSPNPIGDFSLSRDGKWIYLNVISVDGDLWLAEPE